ncbi:MAG: CotH kinase family protein [Bacteroidota bacterium]
MKNTLNIIAALLLCAFSFQLAAQIDHWETVVFAEDNWNYFVGTSAPASNWNQSNFDASIWQEGQGGFGYGDEDDNSIIPNTLSVYLIKKFKLNSLTNIEKFLLDADFDDGFVAYLNGQELTRYNMGVFGSETTFNQGATSSHEASLYRGRKPERNVFDREAVESLLQVGENTLAIEVHNVNSTSSDLSSNFYLSLGKTDTELEYASPPEWFVAPVAINFTNSNLPILIIETEAQQPIPDEPKIVANMRLIANENGRNKVDDEANEYSGQIAIERRGSSSQSFDKKGYGFETQEEDGSNNNVQLLGMPKENDWVLHGPYSDKSLMRNALAYQIGRDLMEYAPRVRFCELLLNGDYQGIYLLTEKIKRDNNRVDINNLKADENSGDDLTGGYLLKIDKFTGSNVGGWTSNYSSRGDIPYQINFQYDTPEADEITPEQSEYIQNYVSDFEDALNSDEFGNAENGYPQYIDAQSFIRFWMVNEIAKNVDGFRLSTYFYKDKNSIDSRLKMGPVWDFNLGFGNADYCTSGNPEGWIFSQFNQICPEDGAPIPFWWERLMEDPNFQLALVEDWRSLRQNILSNEAILSKVDSMQQLLAEAQVRNFARWEVLGSYVWPNFFVADTYEEEISWLRTWLVDRLTWMDQNIDLLLAAEAQAEFQETQAYPNPFYDRISISIDITSTPRMYQVQLVDALGKIVFAQEIEASGGNIEFTSPQLAALPTAVYFYQVKDKNVLVAEGKLLKD